MSHGSFSVSERATTVSPSMARVTVADNDVAVGGGVVGVVGVVGARESNPCPCNYSTTKSAISGIVMRR